MIRDFKQIIISVFFRLREFFRAIRFNIFSSYYARQEKNPALIPIIIINFNQLHYLQQLISSLQKRAVQNIVILDNQSTYPPLLDYYKTLPQYITVERMEKNYGHLVFWKNKEMYRKYGKGYYVLTDADIVPNEKMPDRFLDIMISHLKKITGINKVGLALELNDIPDSYPAKEKVLNWEARFWKKPLGNDVYCANVDTTFALYKPGYFADRLSLRTLLFQKAVRLAGDFTARHGGWYLDFENLTEEQKYYRETATKSSSWKLTNDGKVQGFVKEFGNQN